MEVYCFLKKRGRLVRFGIYILLSFTFRRAEPYVFQSGNIRLPVRKRMFPGWGT